MIAAVVALHQRLGTLEPYRRVEGSDGVGICGANEGVEPVCSVQSGRELDVRAARDAELKAVGAALGGELEAELG